MAPRIALLPDWPEADEVAKCALLPHCGLHDKLLEAVQYGDFLQIKGLLRRGARLDMPCPALPSGSGNLVDWAVHNGNATAAMRLLKLADGHGLGLWLAQTCTCAVYVGAQVGNAELLRELLARGAPRDQRGPVTEILSRQRSALFAAVLQGHSSAGAALVAAGAWPREENREEILRHARWGGFAGIFGTELAKEIRDEAPRPDELRNELQEAILAADLKGVEDVVRRGASLLKHYYSDKTSPHPGVKGRTMVNPVDWAVIEGCPNVARRLLELEEIVELADSDRQGPNTCRALHIAARRGGTPRWIALVRKLLECGADVGQVDPWGRSPLHIAVMNGNATCAQLMVKYGAWAHEKKCDEVLQLAVSQRVACVVEVAGASPPKAIEDAGAGIVEFCNTQEAAASSSSACCARPVPTKSALDDVQTQKELDEVRGLLRRDIAKAVKFADIHAIHALLERGADLSVEVDMGYGIRGNLIDMAVFHHREGTALALLELGRARGIAQDLACGARQAVFWAVQQDYVQLLRELLDCGANPAQADSLCGSALRCAAEQSRSNAVALLLTAGAWKQEEEKELVQSLLKDRRLFQAVDLSSGRGLGIADAAARERLGQVAQEVLQEDVFDLMQGSCNALTPVAA